MVVFCYAGRMSARDLLDHYATCGTCDTGGWCIVAQRLEVPVEGATTRLCSVCQRRGTGHNARTCPQRSATVREAVAADSVGVCGKYHDPTKPLRCHRQDGHNTDRPEETSGSHAVPAPPPEASEGTPFRPVLPIDGKRVSTPAGASPETADGEHLAGQYRPSIETRADDTLPTRGADAQAASWAAPPVRRRLRVFFGLVAPRALGDGLGPWSACVAGDPFCPCVNGVGHQVA